jgi:hypothetical protein
VADLLILLVTAIAAQARTFTACGRFETELLMLT